MLLGAVLVWLLLQVGQWAVTEARWSVVTNNLRLFLIGQFPADQAWRVWLNLAIISVLGGLSAGVYGQSTRALAITLAAFQLMLAALVLVSPLGIVPAAALALNAALVVVGYVAGLRGLVPRRPIAIGWLLSLPLSFLLLSGMSGTFLPSISSNLVGWPAAHHPARHGRDPPLVPARRAARARSSQPAARGADPEHRLHRGRSAASRWSRSCSWPTSSCRSSCPASGGSTAWRGRWAASPSSRRPTSPRTCAAGLQAIPSGQIEASQALGLSTTQMNLYIVLPQALRSVIPANVGLFISLLKDTTLVTIIGLAELLGIGRAVLAQPESFGAYLEVYVFVAGVFFVLCYAMSQASYRLERALGVGTR